MKLSKKNLIRLIEQVAIEKLLAENYSEPESVYKNPDPVEELFNTAFDGLEALGSMIPANHPAYGSVENSLMSLIDAHEQFEETN